ncbi:MAG: lysophospholipid acyltransferase family protein [Bdellovibrionota bacterium]
MWNKIKPTLIAILVFVVYRVWSFTWRLHLHKNEELESDIKNGVPIVFAFWHGHELAMIGYSKHYRFATMTSVSSDGQLMGKVLNWMGAKTSKGSSSRNAVQGLKGLIRLAKSGCIPVVPVDGPRGPIYEPKPGVFELSRLLNAKIYPGGAAASSSILFKKSWNKTFLPHPFAKVSLHWGKPLAPVTKDLDPRDPELIKRLKDAINAAGQSALKEIAQNS